MKNAALWGGIRKTVKLAKGATIFAVTPFCFKRIAAFAAQGVQSLARNAVMENAHTGVPRIKVRFVSARQTGICLHYPLQPNRVYFHNEMSFIYLC